MFVVNQNYSGKDSLHIHVSCNIHLLDIKYGSKSIDVLVMYLYYHNILYSIAMAQKVHGIWYVRSDCKLMNNDYLNNKT